MRGQVKVGVWPAFPLVRWCYKVSDDVTTHGALRPCLVLMARGAMTWRPLQCLLTHPTLWCDDRYVTFLPSSEAISLKYRSLELGGCPDESSST